MPTACGQVSQTCVESNDIPTAAKKVNKLASKVKLSTVGGRAFPVAGPTIWNSLPDSDICPVSVNLPSAFKKTFLFQASFPDIVIDPR